MVQIKSVLGFAAVLGAVSAHPGHDVKAEALERRQYYDSVPISKRSVGQCASKLKERGLAQRAHSRRAAIMKEKRNLSSTGKLNQMHARDLDTVLNTTHLTNDTSLSMDVPEASLFSSDSSCILVPEVTQGPYYVSGEFIRKNMTETQVGIPITVDIQVIDVNTCEPVPNVYIDYWHCNATGVYSGVTASGNGDSSDTSNLDKTFLRGIAATDPEGVAMFESIFPGHYTGRAPHVHIITHTNSTHYTNSTESAGSIQHVGQFFFDQSLISTVEATAPYNTNTQDLTLNADDSILAQEAATEGVDPFVEYMFLGDDISDGLLAWISMGVDMSSDYAVSAAAAYYRGGGVMSDSSGGGGSGGAPGNGSGGAAPSGSAPPSR